MPVRAWVLDPLRDISSAAEDKSDEMGPLMRRLRLVGELLGCTVMIVHHAGKVSESTAKRRPGQRLRGSGAIHGSTDSGIYLGDLGGDGSTTFRNVVDSEIKGARSAGRFTLELKIEDDEQGDAVRATWSVTRESGETKQAAKAAATTKQEAADDDKVFAFVRTLAMHGERLSKRKLRDPEAAAPGTEPRAPGDATEPILFCSMCLASNEAGARRRVHATPCTHCGSSVISMPRHTAESILVGALRRAAQVVDREIPAHLTRRPS